MQSARTAFWDLLRKLLGGKAAAPPAAAPEPDSASPAADPAPTSADAQNRARLLGLRDAVMGGWYRAESREVYEGFAVGPEDVVLDVGCGQGMTAHFCARQGAHVIFADLDMESVGATARLLAGSPARALTPIVSNSDPLPLPDSIATKVISMEVLEHVDDPGRFLRELARVGRPGAQYLLAVPDPVQEGLQRQLAPATFFEKPDSASHRIRGLSSGHLRTIERKGFEDLVTSAGLVVERHGYSSFYWALWFAFFWACEVDFTAPQHPVLDNWARTWWALLDTPDGPEVKRVLDAFMPKSQVIVARKS
ncbi:Methyltransferase domain-containing protein [Rhizobiales bacterium GAS191]|jgi:SAM-dependent methyltransferase|nr:Methyltransferase domain-containing protein [Rhizobiales bacterium GAS113]SEC04881.1 Methyltransferase domain-containing protein [Rhizobiales bacterium GAS191]SED14643.1 Methyltransferase domain-containing protein [Rhizobiales bacterium GAS188]